jgi:hypothetical protein
VHHLFGPHLVVSFVEVESLVSLDIHDAHDVQRAFERHRTILAVLNIADVRPRIDVVLKDPFQVCVQSDRVFGRYPSDPPKTSVEK